MSDSHKESRESRCSPSVLKACAIPSNTWGATWEQVNPSVRERLSKCYSNFFKYVSEGRGLYLFGDYGRGKTALASVLARKWIDESLQSCYWIRANEYPTAVIRDQRYDDYYNVAAWCEEVPLLIVDEYQIRESIKFGEAVIEELFRRRIDNRKSTIITTNVAPTVLEKGYPAMFAVLREGAIPVKVDGENKRVVVGDATIKQYF